jgi:hypothetical protein
MTTLYLPVYSGWTPARAVTSNNCSSGEDEHETRGEQMNFDNDTVGGYAIPVDPMDLLQCESCQ